MASLIVPARATRLPESGLVFVRFVADAMLGRLAKWLRILGYDTLYKPAWSDLHLVRIARAQDRILLTRDLKLARRKGVQVLLMDSDSLDDQLAQLHQVLGVTGRKPFGRCPVCNERLEPIDKAQARGQVPAYVFAKHEDFYLCRSCNRLYWRGTHWERMRERITHWQNEL